jgi:hypothetical protein
MSRMPTDSRTTAVAAVAVGTAENAANCRPRSGSPMPPRIPAVLFIKLPAEGWL